MTWPSAKAIRVCARYSTGAACVPATGSKHLEVMGSNLGLSSAAPIRIAAKDPVGMEDDGGK